MAKILLSFLFKCSFLIPRFSSFMLSFSIKCIFFWLQKFFNQEFVWARIFSKFLLSLLIIMFEKLSAVSGKVFFDFINNFFNITEEIDLVN